VTPALTPALCHHGRVALRDRFVDNRDVVSAVGIAAVWLGLSAVFGGIGVIDWIVAAVLVVGGVLRRQTKPRNANPQRGIYGPPQ